MRLAKFVLVTLAVIAGCGGGPTATTKTASDAGQIRESIQSFNDAARNLDGDLLCQEVIPPQSPGAPPCPAETISQEMAQHPDDWKPITKVTRIQIRGHSATARVSKASRRPFDASFVEVDGRWYMQVFN